MGVYFAPRQSAPWWAEPLTQLLGGQINAMMDRTQEAKKVEGQRAFAGMLSQLAQQNPDLSETELYTRAMADPSYSRAGEQGQGMLKQIMAAREKERGERELLALAAGNDPRSLALRAAVAAQKNGLNGKDVMGLYAPTLTSRNINLGDKAISQSVNPITGQVVGDSLEERIGVDPTSAAKIAYEKGRDNMEYGFKNRELAQRGDQFGQKLTYDRDRDAMDYALKREELGQRGDQFGQKLTYDRDRDAHSDGLKLLELAQRGYETIQGADGQVYFVNPARGTVKPSGMLALAKESTDPAMKIVPDLIKTHAALSASLDPEAQKQAQMVWTILQPILQRMQGGVVVPASEGASRSTAPVSKAPASGDGQPAVDAQFRALMLQKGWSPQEIDAFLAKKKK